MKHCSCSYGQEILKLNGACIPLLILTIYLGDELHGTLLIGQVNNKLKYLADGKMCLHNQIHEVFVMLCTPVFIKLMVELIRYLELQCNNECYLLATVNYNLIVLV